MNLHSSIKRNPFPEIFIFLAILVAGLIYIRYTWIRFENEQSGKLLQIARSIEATIPSEVIKVLAAKPEDIYRPEYKRIKKTLQAIISANPKARFAYIYTTRNNKIFFIADSEPLHSKDYSPPGQEYTEAKPEDKQPFLDGKEAITKPLSDRWGTWRSVFIPIKDDASGDTIAVFGMDFDEKKWNSFILYEIIESSILVSLILLLFYFALKINAKNFLLKNDISELKRADETLRESERSKEVLLSNLPGLAYRCQFDSTWSMEFVSDGCFNLTGYEKAAFIQNRDMPFSELIKPEFREHLQNVWEKAVQDHSKVCEEYKIITADGQEKWVWEQGIPVFNAVGELEALEGLIIDITDRKSAEAVLLESQLFTEEIINAIPVRVFWKDRNLVYLGCNRIFANDAGFADSNDIIGKDDYMMGWHDQAELYRSDDRQVIESGCPRLLMEEVQTTPEGNTINLLTSKLPLQNSKGEIIGVLGSYMDITDRKLAEGAMRESEEKFRNIFEHSVNGKTITSIDGILKTNNAFCQMLGYAEDKLSGLKWQEITHEDDIETNRKIFSSILAGEISEAKWEKRYIHKNGNIVWADICTKLQRDNIGKPLYFITSINDITDRKQAQEEVRLMNTKLELSVKQRTQQLENAYRELEDFSYSVAHNLRSPLRGIDGWSLALLEDYNQLLDDQGRAYLGRVRSEAQNMAALIDNLLNLSRVMRFEMKEVNINFSDMALTIATHYMTKEPDRKFEFIIDPDLFMKADPTLLEIATFRLIDNACKFTRIKPIAHIQIGRTDIDDKPVFYVRDNGAGFDLKNAKNLFGAFQRMHKQTDFPGSGIGLATVHGIISRHGGRIWAESKPGKGATFYFTLN
jgi:PAS domain S-box-containing protein